MTPPIPQRLAALYLPHPIEGMVYDALAAETPARRHADALQVWEVAIQSAATAAWAVCRTLGLESSGLEREMAGMTRPSFGRWVNLLDEATTLLAEATEPEADAIRPLVDGLRDKQSGEDLKALRQVFRSLPAPLDVGKKSVFDLIRALPAYRNRTHGHAEHALAGTLLAENADALLVGLIACLEVAPPCGNLRWVVVRRADRTAEGVSLSLGITHGARATTEMLPTSDQVAERFDVGAVALLFDDRMIDVRPLAASRDVDGRCVLGLLSRQVRRASFQYRTFASGSFGATISGEHYALLDGDAERGGEVDEKALSLAPWRGLGAYDVEHAGIFYGREDDVDRALAEVALHGCVILCGASGAGKSSVMRAGVIGGLALDANDQPTEALVLQPGAHPMSALRAALVGVEMDNPSAAVDWQERVHRLLPPDAESVPQDGLRHLLAGLVATGRSVVLGIDQLEEAWTVCADPDERNAFLDVVHRAAFDARATGAPVVMTVRANLVAGLLEHPQMRALFETRVQSVGGLGRAELLRIISEPLRGRDVSVEPGLAEEIVGDVGAAPGHLALLSQVLTTLWEDRGRYGNRLTKDGYEEAGRVSGALAQRADAARAATAGAAELDRVLVHLASVSADGAFVRTRVGLEELAAAAGLPTDAVRALIAPLVDARLLVMGAEPGDFPRETVEVAHEALLRQWPHLTQLLLLERDAIGLKKEVAAAAREWAAAGRRSELWTDATSRLARAEEMVEAGRIAVTREEGEFLTASRRRENQRRSMRYGAALAIAAAAIVAVFLWRQAAATQALAQQAEIRSAELVDFMVQDLFDTLRTASRTDLMLSIADELEAHNARHERADTSLAFDDRLRALRQLRVVGTARVQGGEREGAGEALRRGLDLAEALHSERPDHREVVELLASARIHFARAIVHHDYEGDAWSLLDSGLDVLDSVPTAEWTPLMYATAGRGLFTQDEILSARGEPGGAEPLARAMTLIQEGADRFPDSLDVMDVLAIIHLVTARQLMMTGQMQDALVSAETGLDIRRSIVAEHPRNVRMARSLIDDLDMPVLAYVQNDRWQEALALTEEQVARGEAFVRNDPSDTIIATELLYAHSTLIAVSAQQEAFPVFAERLGSASSLLASMGDEAYAGVRRDTTRFVVLAHACYASGLTREISAPDPCESLDGALSALAEVAPGFAATYTFFLLARIWRCLALESEACAAWLDELPESALARLPPEDIPVFPAMVRVQLERHAEESNAEALAALDQALAANPTSTLAHAARAELAFAREEFDGAVSFGQQAISESQSSAGDAVASRLIAEYGAVGLTLEAAWRAEDWDTVIELADNTFDHLDAIEHISEGAVIVQSTRGILLIARGLALQRTASSGEAAQNIEDGRTILEGLVLVPSEARWLERAA